MNSDIGVKLTVLLKSSKMRTIETLERSSIYEENKCHDSLLQ